MIHGVEAAASGDETLYNAHGKRDPFIPLISESGGYASDAYEASAAEDISTSFLWSVALASKAVLLFFFPTLLT